MWECGIPEIFGLELCVACTLCEDVGALLQGGGDEWNSRWEIFAFDWLYKLE